MQRNALRRTIWSALALTVTFIPLHFAAVRAETPSASPGQTPTAEASATLEVGMTAPDFDLLDQDGKRHRLADLRGKTVALAFYPADKTRGCTAEMCSLRDTLPTLKNQGVIVFGISVQDVSSKREFADQQHLNFPILADSDKSVSRAYGVLNDKGYADRVTFIISPAGKIKYIDRALRFDRSAEGIVSHHGLALTMALDEDWRAQIGKPVPSFTLPNYDGKSVVSTDAKSKLTVILFISTVCPVSNAYNERMEQLAETYAPKGVRILGVNANNGETPQRIAAHAREHKFTFPVLKDSRNVIADHFQAQHTPEVWVIDARGTARYHGAIDDNEEASEVKTPYLQQAIDAILDGKEPPKTETRAFGCAIHRVAKNG